MLLQQAESPRTEKFVSQGALKKLEKDELEGVLAHELAHIKNHDILFMTVAVALIGVVSILSEILLHSFFSGVENEMHHHGQ